MCRQALAKLLPDFENFNSNVEAWTRQWNEQGGKVNWQFTINNAKIMLKRLYPMVL
jgi:hypothetical protein